MSLYAAVGWAKYVQAPERLVLAIKNSAYVVSAWENETLIALARCVSDDVSIMYLQDILVLPSHQRKGIGRDLLGDCLVHFKGVRQKVLLTDDSPEQLAFYESLGFKKISNEKTGRLNAFVRFEE